MPDGPPAGRTEGGGDAASTPRPDPGHPGASPPGELAPEEEPTTTGTLFVMVLFLMALAGMWILMYRRLLEL